MSSFDLRSVALQAVGAVGCAVGLAYPSVRNVTATTTLVTSLLWCMTFDGTVVQRKSLQLLQLGSTVLAAMLASVALNEEDEGLAENYAIMSCVSSVVSTVVTSVLYCLSKYVVAQKVKQKQQKQLKIKQVSIACLSLLRFLGHITRLQAGARFNYEMLMLKFDALRLKLKQIYDIDGCSNEQQLDVIKQAERDFVCEVMWFCNYYKGLLFASEYGIITRMIGAVETEMLGLNVLLRQPEIRV